MDCLGQVEYIKSCYEEHRKAIGELAQFYADNGVKMVLLKGYGLSLYWPTPEHRPVGDIDIYLGHLWQFGDQMVHDRLGIEVESGHEHHTTFSYHRSTVSGSGIIVENHYDFINVKAHKDASMIEAKLKKLASIGSIEFQVSNGSKVLLPSADFNTIFLIRHLGQHFAGERVTLRQLLDWGLFLQKDCAKVNWQEIVPFLKEMGIWTFFHQICAICEDYFGMHFNLCFELERKPDLGARIIEDVLHPEFDEEKPQGLFLVLWFKMKRWWYNRWKHPLVYNEWLLPMFLTLLWSHIKRIDTIKD